MGRTAKTATAEKTLPLPLPVLGRLDSDVVGPATELTAFRFAACEPSVPSKVRT
jgi:hypothetical protein